MSTERGNDRLIRVQALSQAYINIFANFTALFRLIFFSKKKRKNSTQSATMVFTLWIHRTEDELQSCILVWRHSKERCVHCNWLIVRTFGRHNCVARATAICTSWKVLEVIVSITKFSIVIGPPRAYVSRNRRAITWASNYSCPI